MPASKSRICTFAQLNPGDYLVEEEDKTTPWHHYLVMGMKSHSTSCSAIESWNWTVQKHESYPLIRRAHTISPQLQRWCLYSSQKAVADACQLLGRFEQYKQQNLVKTGNAVDIKMDILQDDHTLLRIKS